MNDLRYGNGKMTRRAMVAVLVGLGGARSVVAAQSRQDEAQANLERNKALVRRWIGEGFNGRDLKVVDVLFSENFTVNRTPVGRGGLRQSMASRFTAFPDLRVSIVEIVAEGDKVGIWYTVQGTQRGEFEGVQPTGKQVSWFGADFLRVESGKFVEAWFVDDSMGLLRQLGVTFLPSPAQK